MKLSNFWENVSELREGLKRCGYNTLYNKISDLLGNNEINSEKWDEMVLELLESFCGSKIISGLFDYTSEEVNKIETINFTKQQQIIDKILSENEGSYGMGVMFGDYDITNGGLPKETRTTLSDGKKTFKYDELSEVGKKDAVLLWDKKINGGTINIIDIDNYIGEQINYIQESQGFKTNNNYATIDYHENFAILEDCELDEYGNYETKDTKDVQFRFVFDNFTGLFGLFQDEIHILYEVEELLPYVELLCRKLSATDADDSDVRMEFNINTPIEVAEKYAYILDRVEQKIKDRYVNLCENVKLSCISEIERQKKKDIDFDSIQNAIDYFDTNNTLFDIYGEEVLGDIIKIEKLEGSSFTPTPTPTPTEKPLKKKTWRDFISWKETQKFSKSIQQMNEKEVRELLANKTNKLEHSMTPSSTKNTLKYEVWDLQELISAYDKANEFNEANNL